MGPVAFANGVHAVDTEFDSYFALLSKPYGRHRLSIRYDNFELTQNDQAPLDDNRENGHALTLSYQRGLSDSLGLVAEAISIKTHRNSWRYFGFAPSKTETQFQLSLRLRL